MNRLIEPPNIINSHIKAFFTGKTALGLKEFLADSGYSDGRVYMPVQKHTDRVIVVKERLQQEIADAVVTGRKGLLIGVQTADCIPILLADEGKMVIAAVHAGWRGTASGILQKTIQVMKHRFNSRTEDIFIAMGPCIKDCCYQVDTDVDKLVSVATGEGSYSYKRDGKFYVDLPGANRLQAVSAGIPESNIWVSGDCTFCKHEKYHSYRYHGNHAGRQGGFIGIF